jgi:outer membrane protein OmpA-like peptidoglycan-associated protein
MKTSALGKQRAAAVRRALVRGGISERRIRVRAQARAPQGLRQG